jgi:hypothetical protein
MLIQSRPPEADNKGFQQLSPANSGKPLQNPHHPRTNENLKTQEGKS